MKLKVDSFFIKHYLRCKPWEVPRTICELAKRALIMTMFYATLISWFVLNIYGGYLVHMKSMGAEIRNGILEVLSLSLLASTVSVFAILVTIFVLIGCGTLYQNTVHKSGFNTIGNTKVVQFTSGIWKRIKDKTCVWIEYE